MTIRIFLEDLDSEEKNIWHQKVFKFQRLFLLFVV